MNIFGRHALFRRKPAEVSRFEGVLPRIRGIRDECDWQPLTSASAAQQRSERVRSARRRIVYHPVHYERGLEWRLPLRRTWWLWLAYGLAVLCVGALLWGLMGPSQNAARRSNTFTYQLVSAPPSLDAQLALAKAKESLLKVVPDGYLWQPDEFLNPPTAPDGTHEQYLLRVSATEGSIRFWRSDRTNASWVVYVQLFGSNLQCTVQRPVIKPD
jgi:hypothetical protein